MATERTHFTTDQVISYLFGNDSSSEDEENMEETFTNYVGIALSDSEEENVDTDPLRKDDTSFSEDSDDIGQVLTPRPPKSTTSNPSEVVGEQLAVIEDTTFDFVTESVDTSEESGGSLIFDCDSHETSSESDDAGIVGNCNSPPDAAEWEESDSEIGTGRNEDSRRQGRGRGARGQTMVQRFRRGLRGRSRGHGRGLMVQGQRGRGRGRGCGLRVRGQRGRGRGMRVRGQRGRGQQASYIDFIPEEASKANK